LPRLALENPPASVYRVRKADHENQLSTLEASCYALQQLERGSVDYSPLLNSLETMVERLLSFRPG
jgi:DTW domain-containing protein YfiP